jgi:hypothetical protein
MRRARGLVPALQGWRQERRDPGQRPDGAVVTVHAEVGGDLAGVVRGIDQAVDVVTLCGAFELGDPRSGLGDGAQGAAARE